MRFFFLTRTTWNWIYWVFPIRWVCVLATHLIEKERKNPPMCVGTTTAHRHTHTQAQRMKCALRSRDGLHTTRSYSCPSKKGPHTNAQKAYVQRMIYKYDSSQFCGKRKGAQKWKEVKRAVCVCVGRKLTIENVRFLHPTASQNSLVHFFPPGMG